MGSPPLSYGFGWRHIIALLSFCAFFCLFMLRINMNVAIVAMVNQTAVKENSQNVDQKPAYCLADTNSSNSINATESPSPTNKYIEGQYAWTTKQQGQILASYYYGYTLTQLPGGWAATRFGAKWVMGLGILIPSILTFLTPVAASFGYELLMALRIIEGLIQGGMFPAMHSMLGKWVPPLERSKMPAFVYAGSQVGTVSTFACSGYLAASPLGWQSIFYISGFIGCAWFLLWFFFVTNSPDEHKWISDAEKAYIIKSIEAEKSLRKQDSHGCSAIPWISFATSLPFIALLVGQVGRDWAFYTILNDLPIYLRTILGFNIQTSGLISSSPYLIAYICQLGIGWFADLIRSRQWLSTTNVRKLFDCSGNFLTGTTMLVISFVGCNRILVVSLFCVSSAFTTLTIAGAIVNHLDLAPIYAGVLFGISNTVANIPGFFTPILVGQLTDNNQTIDAWKKVFYISAAVSFFASIFYLFFGSGELQPWGKQKEANLNVELVVKGKNAEKQSESEIDHSIAAKF